MTVDRLVNLYVPSALEEAVVDALLTLESENGFSSFPVNLHHHENRKLTLAEQVSGRQKQLCFQIYIGEAVVQALINKLKDEFGGAGIYYQILPIIESGKI